MQSRTLFLLGTFFLAGCTSTPEIIITHPQDSSSVASVVSVFPSSTSQSSSKPAVNSILIRVPFQPQAPLTNWDSAHEEACEEMSLILVHHYLEGTPISPERAEDELQKLLSWEADHGYAQDVTTQQLASVAQEYYGHHAKATSDITVEDIKREIAKGNPVIIPAAGRKLGNPYFSGAGPWYHMLVVTGYQGTQFITNDVGTKRGESYRYDQQVFFAAIHDWVGKNEEIEKGGKAMVVVTK